MEKLDEVRRLVLDTVIERHIRHSAGTDTDIRELEEKIRAGTEDFNKIVNKLDKKDKELVQLRGELQLRLRAEREGYMYEQGLRDGFAVCKNPALLLGEDYLPSAAK